MLDVVLIARVYIALSEKFSPSDVCANKCQGCAYPYLQWVRDSGLTDGSCSRDEGKTIKHIAHHPHTSTRQSSPSQSSRRRMSQRSQVPHTATICHIPLPPLLVSSVSISAEEIAHGEQLPFSVNPLPHTVKVVRVKHSEGTSMRHHGALTTLDDMSRKWSAIWGKTPQCTIIPIKKKR